MSEFGGLRKHQNIPAGTRNVKRLQNTEVGYYMKEEKMYLTCPINLIFFKFQLWTHLLCEDFMCEDEAKSGKAVGFDDALQVHQFIALEHGLNYGDSTEKPLQATAASQWQKVMKPRKVHKLLHSQYSITQHTQYNFTAKCHCHCTRKMFCGAKYTRHICMAITKH